MNTLAAVGVGFVFGFGMGILYTDCGKAGWQEDQQKYYSPLYQQQPDDNYDPAPYLYYEERQRYQRNQQPC